MQLVNDEMEDVRRVFQPLFRLLKN